MKKVESRTSIKSSIITSPRQPGIHLTLSKVEKMLHALSLRRLQTLKGVMAGSALMALNVSTGSKKVSTIFTTSATSVIPTAKLALKPLVLIVLPITLIGLRQVLLTQSRTRVNVAHAGHFL